MGNSCTAEAATRGATSVEEVQVVVAAAAKNKAVATFQPNDKKFTVPEVGISIPVRTVRRMGWKRDLPDFRDRFVDFKAHSICKAGQALPKKVDLRDAEKFPVYDQGQLGSCTANAIAAVYHYQELKQGVKKDFCPSRLFIYYNERAMEDTVKEDAGAYIRDGIKSLNNIGVCSEELWAYQDQGTLFTERPSKGCYEAAKHNTAKEYARVEQNLDSLKSCLAAGFPIVFGFSVYEDFFAPEVASTGVMSFPPKGEPQGGHAIHACGYDDDRKVFIIRNSWGDSWGDKGHFYMPYEYITNPHLADDFWAINFITCDEFPIKASPVITAAKK